MIQNNPQLGEKIHENYPYLQADIVYGIKYEMALFVEDILARRTRLLFLDAKAAMLAAPLVANILATELQKNEQWIVDQIEQFNTLAKQYILS